MTARVSAPNRMLILASLESAVRLRKYLILVLASSALTACGLAGGPSPGPDEFAVVTRAPLSLPPDYGLRPPRRGAALHLGVADVDRNLAAKTKGLWSPRRIHRARGSGHRRGRML